MSDDLIAEVAKLIREISDPDRAAAVIVPLVRSHRNTPAAGPKTTGEPLFLFPCVGPTAFYTFTTDERDRLAKSFPDLDVEGEVRRAYAWIQANTSRRKTAGGMRRFLTGWLSRTTNKVRPMAPTSREKMDAGTKKTDEYLEGEKLKGENASETWPTNDDVRQDDPK